MRMAYVSDQRYPGIGTDRSQVATMCSAFGSAGARVTLYSLSDDARHATGGREIADYYEVAPTFDTEAVCRRRIFLRGFEKITFARDAAKRIRESDTDLVYSRNLPAVMAALRYTQIPVFYETYRPWPLQSVLKTLIFRELRRARRLRGLILHSEIAARSYRDIGYEAERVLTAYNGFDPDILGGPLSPSEARARLELDERFTVVYAGDVTPRKGTGIILDIAASTPDVAFILVGSKKKSTIERRAEKIPNVAVFPWRKISAVSPFLFAADLLMIPPTDKPLNRVGNTVLPIKCFYYLAAGRPIIAGDTPDITEVIHHNRNGMIVPVGDVDAASKVIISLKDNPGTRKRLGEQALKDGRKRTWSARAERILQFMEKRLPAF